MQYTYNNTFLLQGGQLFFLLLVPLRNQNMPYNTYNIATKVFLSGEMWARLGFA